MAGVGQRGNDVLPSHDPSGTSCHLPYFAGKDNTLEMLRSSTLASTDQSQHRANRSTHEHRSD
jgi:hypothetical protein